MKNTKISTWLPGFTGFYGSLWEDCGEESEIDNINVLRKEKGFPPITYEDCKFDYSKFYKNLSKDITDTIGKYLVRSGFVSKYKYEKLNSPREYNFSNNSIDVEFTLSDNNKKNITRYLNEKKEIFSEYLKQHYTSYDGFITHYSNSVTTWLNDDYLAHPHKLGAVLNFILSDQLKNEEAIDDIDMWLYEQSENNYIYAKNFRKLTEEI